MHEGEKINKRLCKFFIETFEFTDEQLAAIDYQIPMTQEIYDSVGYTGALGSSAIIRFFLASYTAVLLPVILYYIYRT